MGAVPSLFKVIRGFGLGVWLTGLKRRGGVEVVVESPRAKAEDVFLHGRAECLGIRDGASAAQVNAHREPLSARSSQREGACFGFWAACSVGWWNMVEGMSFVLQAASRGASSIG